MDKPSKCKNCQWYGKPYWSIINPCDNCPMENVETFTRWIDPTIEEYKKEIDRLNNVINELEKWCDDCIIYHIAARENGQTTISDTFFEMVLNKIKELKESKQ